MIKATCASQRFPEKGQKRVRPGSVLNNHTRYEGVVSLNRINTDGLPPGLDSQEKSRQPLQKITTLVLAQFGFHCINNQLTGADCSEGRVSLPKPSLDSGLRLLLVLFEILNSKMRAVSPAPFASSCLW